MARAYSDDLRRRILQAYVQEEGTQEQLAQRFRVSVGYVEKIRGQQLRTGQMERIPHHPGRKPKFTAAIRQQLCRWLQQQPDLTLAELQQKLQQQERLGVSQPSLWQVLRLLGLRLKKSRSTLANGTPKRTVGGGKSSSPKSSPWRRRS
jgi:transposase